MTRFYQPIKLYKVLITNIKEEVRARDKAKENEEAKQKKLSTLQVIHYLYRHIIAIPANVVLSSTRFLLSCEK